MFFCTQVFTIGNGKFELSDTLCGDTIPKPIMSNTNKLLLEFRGIKAGGIGNKGFKVEYRFLESN